MALNRGQLYTDLLSLFEEPPDSVAGCAQEWATIVRDYTATVVPASTTVPVAATTLQTALEGAFTAGNTATDLEMAFLAFATTVASGMAPAFTATPPAGPMGWAASFAEAETTHTDAADKYADLIHTWFLTGTAVPSGGGAAITWT